MLFSALLYWRGEQVAMGMHLPVVSRKRGDAAVLLAAGRSALAALGVVVTALARKAVRRRRAGDFRRALRFTLMTVVMIAFVSGSVGAVAGDSSHYLALLDRRHHTGTVLLV